MSPCVVDSATGVPEGRWPPPSLEHRFPPLPPPTQGYHAHDELAFVPIFSTHRCYESLSCGAVRELVLMQQEWRRRMEEEEEEVRHQMFGHAFQAGGGGGRSVGLAVVASAGACRRFCVCA